jgi:hypothetical protein
MDFEDEDTFPSRSSPPSNTRALASTSKNHGNYLGLYPLFAYFVGYISNLNGTGCISIVFFSFQLPEFALDRVVMKKRRFHLGRIKLRRNELWCLLQDIVIIVSIFVIDLLLIINVRIIFLYLGENIESKENKQNEAGNRRSKISSRPGGMILVHYSFNILIAEVV